MYVIVVTPEVSPVTVPELETVPTIGTLLLQVPPPVVLDKLIVDPIHTEVGPLIAAGVRFTVIGVLT
jgi:hypothetical protein